MKKNVILLFTIFIIVLLTNLFSSDFEEIISRVIYAFEHSSVIKLLFYFGLLLSSIFSLVLLILAKSKMIYRVSIIVIFATFVINTIFVKMGHNFNADDASLLLREYAYAGDALITFLPIILSSLLIATIIIAIYHFIRVKIDIRFTNRYILLIIPIIFLGVLFTTLKTKGFFYFPSTYNIFSNLLYAVNHQIYHGTKDKPVLEVKHKPLFDNIIFIVDESIRGDLLSLNGYKEKTTPFLENQKNIYNYGCSVTTANCSAQSNIIMQHGTQLNNLPSTDNTLTKRANIFQYAKKAGYKTVFIDNQNITESPMNFMSKNDFLYIDREYKVQNIYRNSVEQYLIDFKSIDILKKELTDTNRTFIYLEKLGAHFAYEDKSPKSHKIFQPTMDGLKNLNDKKARLNSYLNSIYWQVDEFFKVLSDKLKDKNVLIIYTSDHGQALATDDTLDGVLRTHCNTDPNIYEAVVPFFVMVIGEKYHEKFQKILNQNYEKNYDNLSSFYIFPTILTLMGYDKDEVVKNFNKTIFDNVANEKKVFVTGSLWDRSFFGTHDITDRFMSAVERED